jgi:hypothetical protein
MRRRSTVCSVHLGDTTSEGVLRDQYPAAREAEKRRLSEFLKFVEVLRRDEDVVQISDRSGGTKVTVKYGSGRANVPLQRAFDLKYTLSGDVTREGYPHPLRDEFMIASASVDDLIKGQVPSLSFPIVVCCVIVIVLCVYLLFIVNPARYRVL